MKEADSPLRVRHVRRVDTTARFRSFAEVKSHPIGTEVRSFQATSLRQCLGLTRIAKRHPATDWQ